MSVSYETPSINNIFTILLPTMLPIAISVLPLRADNMLITNSGVDVPMDTMVRPMTKSGILNRFANDEAPPTKRCAPTKMIASPTIKNSTLIYL